MRQGDERSAHRDARIRVVDDHRFTGAEMLCEEDLLPPLRTTYVAHQILADVRVRGREALPVEARLAGRRKADQNNALHNGRCSSPFSVLRSRFVFTVRRLEPRTLN